VSFMDAKEAIEKLKQGNMRFVNNWTSNKDFKAQREALLKGQTPFATVLTCSDSRVVANYIFDTGLGDIFIVKNAGNVANDDITLGTIEYGVEHLHTPVLIVLSHEFCGAVTATCQCRGKNDEGHIKNIVAAIAPIAEKDGYDVDKSIKDNMNETIRTLPQKSEIIKKLVDGGRLSIVGAYYSLTTGKVEFFEG
jgi:carbonic anhydrase